MRGEAMRYSDAPRQRAVSRGRVVVGGDVCPVNRNLEAFQRGDEFRVFTDLLDEFRAADLSVVNLECPLIAESKPIAKSGPVLGVDASCAMTLRKAGIRAVTLANNHILDHGPEGLRRTIGACAEAGIDTFGAGETLARAAEPLIKEIAGMRVAFLGMAEHEFCIAGRDSAGANPIDVIAFRRLVRERSRDYDHLVVLLHAGREFYPYPSPRLQKLCRFLVEEGASAVVCQHSHCAGAFETYLGAVIIYGQGNLLFDLEVRRADWRTGYLAELTLEAGTPGSMLRIVPHRQPNAAPGVGRMGPDDEAAMRTRLENYNRLLASDQEIERLWMESCADAREAYLSILRGHGALLRTLNRRLPFGARAYSARASADLLGIVRCETHQETLTTILRAIHEEKNGLR